MFGYPVQKVSISSPCQVTCAPLYYAIESGLGNKTHPTSTNLSFCNQATFTENVISQCVFCYGLMDDQKYLANCEHTHHRLSEDCADMVQSSNL